MDLFQYLIASRGKGGGGAEGKITITQNGTDLNIAQYATADVAVQPNLQTAEATPTEQTQTITPDDQHDGLSSVQVNPIPSQYIVPTGKTTLSQNATDVDIAQYASVDVAVTPVLTPTLIDTIDIGDFAEQVNIVEIDPTAYDMTGRYLLWIEADEVTFTASDWIYMNTSGNALQYLPSQALTHSFKKCFFAKIDDTWRNLMSVSVQASGRITNDGDEILTTLKKINLKPYGTSTKFASGRIYVYAY